MIALAPAMSLFTCSSERPQKEHWLNWSNRPARQDARFAVPSGPAPFLTMVNGSVVTVARPFDHFTTAQKTTQRTAVPIITNTLKLRFHSVKEKAIAEIPALMTRTHQ
jgi:hypothetical protein